MLPPQAVTQTMFRLSVLSRRLVAVASAHVSTTAAARNRHEAVFATNPEHSAVIAVMKHYEINIVSPPDPRQTPYGVPLGAFPASDQSPLRCGR